MILDIWKFRNRRKNLGKRQLRKKCKIFLKKCMIFSIPNGVKSLELGKENVWFLTVQVSKILWISIITILRYSKILLGLDYLLITDLASITLFTLALTMIHKTTSRLELTSFVKTSNLVVMLSFFKR